MATVSVRSPVIEAFKKNNQRYGPFVQPSSYNSGFVASAQSIPTSALTCLHCDYTCQSSSDLSKHRWEKHPLLTRRKQHLMRSRKRQNTESSSSSSSSSDSSGTDEPTPKKAAITPPPTPPPSSVGATSTSSSLLHALVQIPAAKQKACFGPSSSAIMTSSTVNFHQVTSLASTVSSSSKSNQVSVNNQKEVTQDNSSTLKPPSSPFSTESTSSDSSDDVQIISEKKGIFIPPAMPKTLTTLRNMSIAEMNMMAARAGSLTCAPSISQLKSHLCGGKSHHYQQQPPSVASPNLTSLVTQYQHLRGGYRHNNGAPKSTAGMSLRDHLMASHRATAASSSNVPTSSRQKVHHSVHTATSHAAGYRSRFAPPKYDPHQATKHHVEATNVKQLLQQNNSRLHQQPQQQASASKEQPRSCESPAASRSSDTCSPLSTLSDVASQILQNDNLNAASAAAAYTQDIDFKQHRPLRPVSRSPSECSSSSMSSSCSSPPYSPHSPMRSSSSTSSSSNSGCFDLSKHTKDILSSGKPVMQEEQVKTLIEAIKNVDCCDPNERSNVMPFRCEDGTWKMVRVKRIGGAWLMQMPGKQQPVVFIPRRGGVSPLVRSQARNTVTKTSPSAEKSVVPTSAASDNKINQVSSTQNSSVIKSLLTNKSTLSKILTL